MTPGEQGIYDYIAESNAHYACLNIQVNVTDMYIKAYSQKEIEKIRKLEPKITDFIFSELKNLPLLKMFFSGHLLSMVYNDIHRGIEYLTCSQGCWTVSPLNGKGVIITYGEFNSKLGISKDVAKSCIERLVEKGEITRKRGIGGYEYLTHLKNIKQKMIENYGKWKPQRFDQSTMTYEEDKTLWPIIDEAQKELEPIQQYYERLVKEECDKLDENDQEEIHEESEEES